MSNKPELIEFPKGFFWGSSTSAHQVEGGNINQWSEWEKTSGSFISGKACDHYNRFEKDFDLAKNLHNNAHRLSVEWSRIESQEGKFNQAEIEHYRKVIKTLKARGLEPFVTLWHYTLPIWFAQKGGFEKRENIKYFVRFCNKVVSEFEDEVKYWIIINEPMVYAGLSYLKGERPPQKKSLFLFLRVVRNLVYAHRAVYEVIRGKHQIGIAHQANYYEGWLAPFLNWFWVKRFLGKIKNHLDFIGINYYYRRQIHGLDFDAGKGKRSDLGWEIYPKGIYYSLKLVSKQGKPLYITENGLADAYDRYRSEFVVNHLFWVNQAIREGVDVRGYFHWSLIDNFEWDKGFEPRFGLFEVNYATQERKARLSSETYARICKVNGIERRINE